MYNEEAVIPTFFETIVPILNSLPVSWELVCVNDGSKDKTLQLLREKNAADDRIKIVNLSRNFGKENALTAGLDYSTGDAVIPIDVDLQDPPDVVPQMVDVWLGGADIVNAARRGRDTDTWTKRTTSRYFYKVINVISNVELAQDVGDYRLISRRACDVLRNMRERRRFMKGLFSWVGFPVETIYYDRAPRAAGTTKWNYWKLWNLALEGITSFSTVPLRIATYLGLVVALFSLSYALYLVVDTLIYGNPVSGYPSLMTAILFLGGVQLIFVGVIGEYIGRIHEEVKQRPIYVVESAKGF
jgi:glycosyltransferase involved in cell wall biosynthesis